MKHLQKAPKKPLLDTEQGKVFVSLLDDDTHKKIAKSIFVDGATNEEVADDYFYCKRQVERIRIELLKKVLKNLIEKQIPKKVQIEVIDDFDYSTNQPYQFKIPLCSVCGGSIGLRAYKCCPYCGQALDWSDTE